MVELRRHSRIVLDTEIVFFPKGSKTGVAGKAADVSVGGMFVTTDNPLGFGADLVVHLVLPGQIDTLVLPGVVRWLRSSPREGGQGMGVQFGLIGVRETHAITEYIAAHQK